MDDDSLPIYEDVDEVTSESKVASRSEYKALDSQDCVPEEYQLPVLNTDYEPYSQRSYKYKSLNKKVTNLIIFVMVGGVILLLLVLACIVAGIVASVRFTSKSYTMYNTVSQQLHTVEENVKQLNSTRTISIFDQCYEESQTCNFTYDRKHILSNCFTGKLNIYQEVCILFYTVHCKKITTKK